MSPLSGSTDDGFHDQDRKRGVIVTNRDAGDLIHTGELISPQKAKEINLLDELWPAADAETKAMETIKSIASLSKQAIAVMK